MGIQRQQIARDSFATVSSPSALESFFPYEDVVETMAHELAHCERGSHDKKFCRNHGRDLGRTCQCHRGLLGVAQHIFGDRSATGGGGG